MSATRRTGSRVSDGPPGATAERPWVATGGLVTWGALALFARVAAGTAAPAMLDEFVLGCFAEPAVTRRPTGRGATPPWLARVRERLCDAPGTAPSLAALAREGGVHPMHLARAFRARYGVSVGEFVQAARVGRACELLLTSRAGLSQVGLALGYHDQAHFTRQFAARLGVPPGAYRRGVVRR